VIGAWQMSHFTLETTSAGVVSSLIIQGVGFSFLFVPLTTVALASIPRAKMTDATGLNSLLRQIGGSVGLAIFATLLGNFATQARVSLSANISALRPEVLNRLAMTRAGLTAQGFDGHTAQIVANQVMGFSVLQQSMVLSFEKLFLLAGMLFLLVLPLLLFLKTPEQAGPVAEVHVEL
jgi:DHA2 family multidrug resistance protein